MNQAATTSADKYNLLKRVVALRDQLNAQGTTSILNPVDLLLNQLCLDLIRYKSSGSLEEPLRTPRAVLMRAIVKAVNGLRLPGAMRNFVTTIGRQRARDVVFLPVEPTHTDQLVPIASALETAGHSTIFFTNRRRIRRRLAKRGINSLFYDQLLQGPAGGLFPIVDLVSELRSANTASGSPLSEQEIDCVLASLVWRRAYLADLVTHSTHVLNTVRPKLVFVGNDLTADGRVIVRLCQRRGIKTASIMHGNVSGEPQNGHHIVDRFFVYGEAGRTMLTRFGVKPDAIVVTGAPYLDDLGVRTSPDALHRALGIPSSTPVVLVALSGREHDIERFERLLRALTRASAAIPNAHFVFKLHRRDRRVFYRPVLEQSGARLTVVEHEQARFPTSIFDYLREAAVLVTVTSTVAVEALLARVPVVTACLFEQPRDVDFIDRGATLHVTDESALVETLRRLLVDRVAYPEVAERAESYVRDFYCQHDGGAASRVRDGIKDLLHIPAKEP